ncbi:Lysosomal Pro-X carboxypeptidase [Vitis vinifera]|uniref:Lysosomal Pro-X carboxypeptidase n=1 Tax=Vitis vinifera TaxID=29760 RepID=A0A438GVI7_VITVI|nr:Lysosomal Pro-X carboxypeptidase [Vitis vinifera]
MALMEDCKEPISLTEYFLELLLREVTNLAMIWGNQVFHQKQKKVGIGSELVIPIGRGSNDTMFPAAPFDFKEYADSCKYSYGVTPRPIGSPVIMNIKLILKRFGSNIIFSNGLRDPYSSGGVLEDISHSIIAVHTPRGSHCLDILPSTEDDPNWLVLQRNVEIEIIHGWLLKYYEDLLQSN